MFNISIKDFHDLFDTQNENENKKKKNEKKENECGNESEQIF